MRQAATDVEGRRVKVAELLLARASVREIARRLEISKSTAARDVVAVRSEWLAQRRASMDEVVAEDLARLAAAEAAIWPQITAGKWLAIDRLLKIMERRAALLGLDAPTQINVMNMARDLASEKQLDPERADAFIAEVARIASEHERALRSH